MDVRVRVAVERRARVDEDGARAAVLALPLLEARERAVERGLLAGLELPLPELAERALVGVARERRLLLPLLPPRVLQVRREARVARDEALEHGARAPRVAAPLLERRVRVPRAVVGLPRHPPLEDGAARGVVLDHLLHERVLVPELVDARQDRRRAVPDVARVVHELVPHLHLRVLEPERLRPVVDVERALEDAPRALERLLRLLPLGVLDVVAEVHAVHADRVLEALALRHAVLAQLVGVRDLRPLAPRVARRRPAAAVVRLAQQLLRGDLDRRRRPVLDAEFRRHVLLFGRRGLLVFYRGPRASCAATDYIICPAGARHEDASRGRGGTVTSALGRRRDPRKVWLGRIPIKSTAPKTAGPPGSTKVNSF